MKKLLFTLMTIVLCLATAQDRDQSETPFIEAQDSSGNTTTLPLKEISAQVNIAGTIADIISKQVYVNNSTQTINATYVFPSSTNAAVYGMQMKIGDRIIEAQIMKKEKAKETFEKATEEGKTASLLTQNRPNVFQMNSGNIQPNDRIEIELKYTE